ncbi:similar to Saccharomyces cerevisiae YJL083W TAX4 EH domain-containing protein involved in regulating phosphatidylinositol 4,5-bisphosphate levels and autophagy [Maudiozyma saulgeensis]|uniref:Similar to Saccharomyces cerevisiae YJL083W TAX4 EH domain-containing protein involved in regulating phosphatidylinositol 4,5-bisphosphate levels and autophagy n=1 Tax=Maudiozyma saulgeensis TaxID=1789683 RepID=A0A1X7R7Z0_9SACH|nr:similar to Saccharomyces cerevisiae YJL083W TAX4 EH domain-containing protein involved in regulating phosphatidylinositol 4,5-bisphosphate levels and autophagy [Kazachstania saulgeensis]
MFSKGKKKPPHINAEAVLSEEALNDSLRAAQVIFQRHSKGKVTTNVTTAPVATAEVRQRPTGTKLQDQANTDQIPRRINTGKSPIQVDIESSPQQVLRRPTTTKSYRPAIPQTSTKGQSPIQSPISSNVNDGRVQLRRINTPKESNEPPKRKHIPVSSVSTAAVDAAHIAAALAHSYVADSDKDKKIINSPSRINDDEIVAKSIKQEVKRDVTPPIDRSPTPEPIEPRQFHNFEQNRRRMEIPQPVRRERIRPIQLLDETRSQDYVVEEHPKNISSSVLSSTRFQQPTPMARTASEPIDSQIEPTNMIDDENDFDDHNSIGNQSLLTRQQQASGDTESLNLENQNFSIGTNILPRKKGSSKKNPLKKIFGKGTTPSTSYNTTSRNFDPLLANNNNTVTQNISDPPMAAAMAAAAKGPIYVPNPKPIAAVYSNTNSGSTSSINTATATQMRFKTTMRYENHKKSFNEDKPWKAHKDAKFMSEIERKRYEGMWVSNRYRYLNMLYWWPVDDIRQETDGQSASEGQSAGEDSRSLASTQGSRSNDSSRIELNRMDTHTTLKSEKRDETMINDVDNSNLVLQDHPVINTSIAQDRIIQEHTKDGMNGDDDGDDYDSPGAGDYESEYFSDIDNERYLQMNRSHSIGSNNIKDNDGFNIENSPRDTPSIIRTSSPVPFSPQNTDFTVMPGSRSPAPDYSDILLTLPQDGLILNLVVKDIWGRSNLPDDLLRQIYDLVDTRNDGTLDRRSFLVGMWLVDQCLYGRKLPVEVDRQIWNSVDGYVLNVIQPRVEPTVKIKRRGKRNIVGRELSNIKKGIRHVHL